MFSFLAVFLPLILMGSSLFYYRIKVDLETRIEQELQKSSDSLANLIRTAADISVKNSLQAMATQNFEIAEYYYSKHRSGLISYQEAVDTIEEIFLSQAIGISGYIYCLNSKGDVFIHPNDKVKGSNVSQYDFVQQQMAIKDGYLEYEWQNPEEKKKRSKALYMIYYKPMDWIISVTSYRSEFSHLIDLDELQKSFLAFKSGKSGYAFIVDKNGKALIHPTLKGQNLLAWSASSRAVIKNVFEKKNGKLTYQWQNPEDSTFRDKILIFKYLPDLEWYVGSTSYVDEVFSPLTRITLWVVASLLIFLVIFTAVTLIISKTVTKPLENLTRNLEAGAKGDYSVRMAKGNTSEIQALSDHFNTFMDRLEDYHGKLNREIKKTVDTQAALVENELKLRGLFNQSFQYTCILSPYGILEEVNKSALEFGGCTEADVLYKPYWETPWWQHDPKARDHIQHALEAALQGKTLRLETTHMKSGGQVRDIDMSVKPIFNNSGKVEFIVTEGRDITELKQAEKERSRMLIQLEKSQKMEAIGTLAGGIAHDFNNILSSIFGYTQLAEMTITSPEKAKRHIGQIVKGAQRASGLVQQILTFSRQTEYKKQPLKLYLVVKESIKLMRSSIPTTIEIRTDILSKEMVSADPTQMHQVIMNLCTNAYHAMMKTGGVLTIALDTVPKIPAPHNPEGFPVAGPQLCLTVRDTGHGMDEQTLAKAFDPYFTTKEIGRGTGFGLALVHAIVDEHHGVIHAESTPGKGSIFYIYMPIATRTQGSKLKEEADPAPRGGRECILVADDEEDIRELNRELLETYGYTVVTCENGQQAFEVFAKDPTNFDLVLTDMTMPAMTGAMLAQKLMEIRKELPVILCTGYSETITQQEADLIGIKRYLQKPIQNKVLLREIRDVLDQA